MLERHREENQEQKVSQKGAEEDQEPTEAICHEPKRRCGGGMRRKESEAVISTTEEKTGPIELQRCLLETFKQRRNQACETQVGQGRKKARKGGKERFKRNRNGREGGVKKKGLLWRNLEDESER